MLCGSEKVTCAPDFQVSHGNLESAAQFSEFPYSIQTFFRHLTENLPFPVEKVCSGNLFTSSDTSPHLINLRQSQPVGVIYQHGIGVRLINAIFNQRRTEKNIKFTGIEIHHNIFQLPSIHTAVGYSDGDIFRQNLPEVMLHSFNGINAVVNEVCLPMAFLFADNGIPYQIIIIFGDIGLDGMAVGRCLRKCGHIPHPGKGHVECSWNRGSRKGQHIDSSRPGFPLFLLYNAEALFFIHNEKSQLMAVNLLVQNGMRSNNDIYLSRCQFLQNQFLLFRRDKPVEDCHPYAKRFHPLNKVLIMLLRQNGGRNQNHSLVSAHYTFKHGAHGHFRLAKSHIAAKEHIHRLRFFHSLLYLLYS